MRHTRAGSAAAAAAAALAFAALLLAPLPVAALVLPGTANASDWALGRATFYGGKGDGFSIHEGSCEFGQVDPTVGTGWDIAALSDMDPEFEGSCGRCYEVACVPGTVVDGFGEELDRADACRNGSVVVRITDSCPCIKPENPESNKRWCCGDARQLDLSWRAFEKIGHAEKGVVGVRFRQVPCPTGPKAAAAAARPALLWTGLALLAAAAALL
ncbi:hypothetical protein Rsub_10931 [Raphidocelis subcapitata]|uniref:Expansin-like EG45 domain-containing protein n=1 Tax=Raphidocelis subcapitata TaxID=307507 RepID=A0A2V0PEJ1_9CHLO|nr:hypothetical protein Rsub_10931 [Raphidocelis subcapitata]|eukprot:GBF98268.1 hypothetical protein Rsub_10931 [Raphidocelis subcapitata]